MAALNVSALLDALSSSHGDKNVREAVASWLGAPAPKGKSKAKKAAAASADGESSAAEDKPKRAGPDAWNAFINLVCGPKDSPTSGFAAWLADEDNAKVKGNKRMVYAKEMKGEDDRDYEAFKAEFKSTASSASSSDGAAAAAEKPKRKPGRPKKAEKAAGGGLSESEEEAPKAKVPKAKKAPDAPKKAKKAKELPPLPASDSEDAITRIELFGQEFFWDQEDGGALYEVAASKFGAVRGEKVGTYDGHSAHFE
jgi:hypothetical protein